MWILSIHTSNTSIYPAAPVAAESGQGCWGCGGQGLPEYTEGNIDPLSDLFLAILGENANSVEFGFFCARKIHWFGKNILYNSFLYFKL